MKDTERLAESYASFYKEENLRSVYKDAFLNGYAYAVSDIKNVIAMLKDHWDEFDTPDMKIWLDQMDSKKKK